MPADYNIPMTDAQITEALQLMVERVSEGWAQETYDGSPVGSGSPYYHKSSKYWATRSEDAAARAEAAVPASTAGAVFFDRAQTLTTAQQEQARQNIKAGGSNRNLLDNPWFTINQRGATTWTTGFGVDRWAIYNASATANADHTISLTHSNTGAALYQRIPYDIDKVGKAFCVSIEFANGIIFSAPLNIPSSGGLYSSVYNGIQISLSTNPNNHHQFTINKLDDGNTVKIKAVKLEAGSTSTLANDYAPNHAEELAKCQRYFVRLANDPLGFGFISGALTRGFALLPLPVTLRTATPTISINGSAEVKAAGETISVSSIVNYASWANAANGLGVQVNFSTSAAAVGPFALSLLTNGYIDISADL